MGNEVQSTNSCLFLHNLILVLEKYTSSKIPMKNKLETEYWIRLFLAIVQDYLKMTYYFHTIFSGESDYDREELLAAASFACNGSCMFLILTVFCLQEI